MAAPSVKNVAAAKPMVGGGVYYVAGSTPLPTDADTALPAPILAGALGYVSEDGLVPSRDTDVEKIKAWGGDVVAALLTDQSKSFEFTLLEAFSEAVQKFVHGASNVTVTPATASVGTKLAIVDKGGKPDPGVFVFDMRHGAKRRRIVVPVGDAVITDEAPYTDSNLSAYTVTVEALKDTSGVRVYEWLSNDDKTA